MTRLRLAAPAVLVLLAVLAAAALGAVRERSLKDPRKDANSGVLDIAGVRFGAGPDGRLRAVVTMTGRWSNSALLAGEAGGPPGSVCVRLWTKADASAAPPDHLACATAQAPATTPATGTTTAPAPAPEATLRGELLTEVEGREPRLSAHRVAVTRPTRRTITIRFSQSAIGKPNELRFVVEATRGGCPRTTCTDRAPRAGRSALLRLREPTTAKTGA